MVDSVAAFQRKIAELFFGLPEASGFVLAGGAALRAHELITRPTRDVDFFAVETTEVDAAVRAFKQEATRLGWIVKTVVEHDRFVRMTVAGPEVVLVDFAVDTAPLHEVAMTGHGPTLHPRDLAGRKMLALFDRAEARDFADVFVLSRVYGRETLVAMAATLDTGFDLQVFAEMLDTLGRFEDEDIPMPPDDVAQLRGFFSSWRQDLTKD